MNEILNAIGKNPDIKLVVYGIIGIVILYVVLRLFKLPLKLLINGIFGVILLYIVNFLVSRFKEFRYLILYITVYTELEQELFISL